MLEPTSSGYAGIFRMFKALLLTALYVGSAIPLATLGQTSDWPWPDSLDALVAAPNSHRVLLENEEVRVLEVTIDAGQKEPHVSFRASDARMRIAEILSALVVSTSINTNDVSLPLDENISVLPFADSDLPQAQCGCWYYYPASHKLKGKVIAVGESAEDALHVIINGERVVIGNWHAEYQDALHSISYENKNYTVKIISAVLVESNYSSEYESEITIRSGNGESTLKVFGSCGC